MTRVEGSHLEAVLAAGPYLPAEIDRRVARGCDDDVSRCKRLREQRDSRLRPKLHEGTIRLLARAVRVHPARGRLRIGPVRAVGVVAHGAAECRNERVLGCVLDGQERGQVDVSRRLDMHDRLRAERVADDDCVAAVAEELRVVELGLRDVVAWKVGGLSGMPQPFELGDDIGEAPPAVPSAVNEHETGHRRSIHRPVPGDKILRNRVGVPRA